MGLMKLSVLVLTMVAVTGAYAAEPVLCNRVITIEPTENGPKVKPQDYGIQVFPNGSGWVAEIVRDNICTYESNVEVGELADFAEAQYVTSIAAPQIDWTKVASVRYAAVGAPRADRTATVIYEVTGKNGKRLTTVVRTVWSVGVCGI